MQDWFGYKKEPDAAGRPKYTFDGKRFTLVFQSWMFSRIVSTSDRQFREYLEGQAGTGNAGAILDFLTGLRAKDLNLTDQQERIIRERTRAAQDALQRRGVGAEFRKYYEPKAK
jgi:hypothetical protein